MQIVLERGSIDKLLTFNIGLLRPEMRASVSQPSLQAATTAGFDSHNWSLINEELATMICPLHSELVNNITPSVAAKEFASLVSAHLEHRCALKKSPTQSIGLTTNGQIRERAIVRLTKCLAELKNQSRHTFPHNPFEFLNVVRVHRKSKTATDHYAQHRSARKQEKAFRNNPWKFSKSIYEDLNTSQPTFSMQICLDYFQSTYSEANVSYKKLPDWVREETVADIQVEFDLSAITPGLIKCTLQKCSSTSSPGSDGITYMYFHLRNLPCTHHFLATVFSKILLFSQSGPSS